MEKKITKVEMFQSIIALATESERADIVKFCEHEIELLAKKKSGSSPSAQKKLDEQTKLKDLIFDCLSEKGEPMMIVDLQKASSELADLSCQKISASLKKLVDEKAVIRSVEKGKTYFSAAVADSAETDEAETE